MANEMREAYNNYANALANQCISIEELDRLYNIYIELKLEVEGRD